MTGGVSERVAQVDSDDAHDVLDLQAVYAGYTGTTVLNGVSVRVPKGGVAALLGANGVGKTTLLRVVSGLVATQRGSVTVEGKRTERLPAHRVARLGVTQIPEGRGIFPGLTVRENLELVEFTRREDRRDVPVDGLELFPILRERIEQRAGTLSGGEQQMLAVARALRARPTLLLLDEPSLGMAPLVVEQLYDVLEQIKAAGVAMLLAEQAAKRAISIADHVYVLGAGGRIVAEGPAADFDDDAALLSAYLS